MSGFPPSQILGWHSATGSAAPVVKRFKLYMTSNPDTRAVSIKTLCLIQRKKPSPVCKYRKRLDFAGLSRHLLSVEAQRLFYCQCFSPGPDAAGGHSDRPGKGKIKKYAKIKKCNYSSGGSKSSSVHLRMICLVRSSGRGTSSSAKYSTFTTSAAEWWLSLPTGTIT